MTHPSPITDPVLCAFTVKGTGRPDYRSNQINHMAYFMGFSGIG